MTYFKRENSPQLLAKNIPMTDNIGTPVRLSDFLTHAWAIANNRARELGWILGDGRSRPATLRAATYRSAT